jgi:hypothetical protein
MTLSWWTSWKTWLLVLPLALAAPGTAGAVPGHAKGTIFVADGAGGAGLLVDGIAQQVANAQLPLNVQQVYWSTLNEATDFQSQYNFAVKSKQFAHRILEMHKHSPNAKIYLVGFGAGTTVILKAAECLPPNTVTHIILLASTVSCNYDLRPALLSSCEGIDSFYSPNDELLKCAIKRYGTTDVGVRGATTAAGLTCFHALSNYPRDKAIYSRLRQYCVFGSSDRNLSVHLAYVNPQFIRTRVVSIIETSLLHPGAFPSSPIPPASPCPPPAPHHPAPQYPAPQYPVPPAPECPAPQSPVPHYPTPPAPQYPAPQYPTPQTPAPQYPTPPAPQYPAPQYPTPQTPAPQYSPPAPQNPAPAPQYPSPLPKGPEETCPLPPLYPPSAPTQAPQAPTARPAIYQNVQQVMPR